MKLELFDLCGLLSVVFFGVVLAVDLPRLGFLPVEVELQPSPEQMQTGFREGVSWYGLYVDEAKVGFVRKEQRRSGGDRIVRSAAVLDLDVMGSEHRVRVDLAATMNRMHELERVELSVIGGVLDVRLEGKVVGSRLGMTLELAGVEHQMAYDLERPPTIGIGAYWMVLRRNPEPGSRITVEVFDPLTASPRPMVLEYEGPDELALIDGAVPAHHIRRRLEGMTAEVWVNDVGEVLREQLPFGVTAVRETESDATWGFTRGASGEGALKIGTELLDEVSRGISQIGDRP